LIAFEDIPFIDLEHDTEGQVQQVDVEQDIVQTTMDGESKEYDLWRFLDTAAFPTEEGEDEFFGELDPYFDYVDEDADDDGVPDDVDTDFDLGPGV
jgi:hypothetical protein